MNRKKKKQKPSKKAVKAKKKDEKIPKAGKKKSEKAKAKAKKENQELKAKAKKKQAAKAKAKQAEKAKKKKGKKASDKVQKAKKAKKKSIEAKKNEGPTVEAVVILESPQPTQVSEPVETAEVPVLEELIQTTPEPVEVQIREEKSGKELSYVSETQVDDLETQQEEPNIQVHAASPEPVEELLAEAVQCAGMTRAGNRCKRTTRHPSGLCTIHQKKLDR